MLSILKSSIYWMFQFNFPQNLKRLNNYLQRASSELGITKARNLDKNRIIGKKLNWEIYKDLLEENFAKIFLNKINLLREIKIIN